MKATATRWVMSAILWSRPPLGAAHRTRAFALDEHVAVDDQRLVLTEGPSRTRRSRPRPRSGSRRAPARQAAASAAGGLGRSACRRSSISSTKRSCRAARYASDSPGWRMGFVAAISAAGVDSRASPSSSVRRWARGLTGRTGTHRQCGAPPHGPLGRGIPWPPHLSVRSERPTHGPVMECLGLPAMQQAVAVRRADKLHPDPRGAP